jgi:ABC-2 type transport system ATP-binding protein
LIYNVIKTGIFLEAANSPLPYINLHFMKLTIDSLSKTYPNGVKALKNVSFVCHNGMFGLLGPNGAGKSTLMRTIATLQDPDTGNVHLDGLDVLKEKTALRRLLGYLPQEFGVYPRITAEEMLDHIARLKGVNDAAKRRDLVAALLERVNLTKDKKKRLGGFSGGMKQRFGIAQALIGEPKLIIVDEPTAGLDPAERNRFYNLLSRIGENTIVILSTHIVEDVSTLCSQFAIICDGEVMYLGEPDAAVMELAGKIYTKLIGRESLARYKERHQVLSTHLKSGDMYIRIFSETTPGDGFIPGHAGLEDVYFKVIGEQADVAGINS